MVPRQMNVASACFQCRTSLLRAFASAGPLPIRTSVHPPLTSSSTTFRLSARRQFMTTKPDGLKDNENVAESDSKTHVSATEIPQEAAEIAGGQEKTTSSMENQDESSPWYLEVEPPQHVPTQHAAPMPDIPEGAPPILEPLMKFVYEEMGLDEMSLLDLRAMDPTPALGPNLLMLFGTARSERHLHISSSRLVKWLRNTYRIDANADGLIGPGELKTKLGRLRKRAKLLGSSAITKGGDDGISTGWICVNLGTIGDSVTEAARFDDDGKLTGFGGPVNGTTLIVQVMTHSRRTELNLEHLWGGQLRRSKEADESLKVDEDAFLQKFGKKLLKNRPRPGRATRTSKSKSSLNLGQRRGFSTTSRRATTAQVESSQASHEQSNVTAPQVPSIHDQILDFQLDGTPITTAQASELLHSLFLTTQPETDIPAETTRLATSFLRTMSERGLPVLSYDTIVPSLEAIVISRASGPNTTRIQSNLEHLLTRTLTTPPKEDHILRLLEIYVRQSNWPRFWDTWRLPARHSTSRPAILYRYVFHRAATLNRPEICADVLRTCVQEMLVEDPPVLPQGSVWDAVKACIHVADPGAEALSQVTVKAKKGTTLDVDDFAVWRRLNREFVKMYRELDALRQNGTPMQGM